MSELFRIAHIKEQLTYLSRHNIFLSQGIEKIITLDRLSETELANRKEKKAMAMIRHARKNSPFYKEWLGANDLRGSFGEVCASLPVMTKTEVRSNLKNIPTTSLKFLKAAHTSGTSGTPLTVYRSPGSILRENVYQWHHRMSHGLKIGDPVVSMRANLDRNTLYYFNKSENTLYLSCFLLSGANIREYVRLITKFAPKAIFCLPSSMYTMVNLMNEANLKVHVPMVFTSSSTVYPFMRERIESTLDTRVFDWYGNVERTIALRECIYGNYHEPPMYSINEFLDDGVITTGLTNRAFPLIRYRVDDVFHEMSETCGCGKTMGMKHIEGRFEDAVMLSDGSLVNGLGTAFKGIRHLQYSQIIQDKVNKIQVNIVITEGFNDNDLQLITKRLRLRLNDSVVIDFNKVREEDIIKTPAGKFTLIISTLKNVRQPENIKNFSPVTE